MKKLLSLFLLLLFVSCAKQVPEFVPLTLQWFEYKGDTSAFDKTHKPTAIDTSLSEKCIISMTRELMAAKQVRIYAENGMEYNVQYYGISQGGNANIVYRGSCAYSNANADYEIQPMKMDKSTKKACLFTARCNSEGSIKDLKFF